MERIPSACAMEWSIQLEKGLRSLKPDKSIEALEEIGRRLEWWNSEPELTAAEYRMFGLVPSEDKLFLNAIFLRLADAFRFGDRQIKSGVAKLFLGMRKRNKRGGKGILSMCILENYLELLSRVKEVFGKGDVDEKTLALVLFGCWAYLAKDCVDVRYIVLSSLVSGDVPVVKAALFAAGCFCELSDDFANVFLEILSTMVLSREISRDIKIAGTLAFGKSWCSFPIADKAYKTGLKLLMASSEDDFSAMMLISLSRIASRWMLLFPIQVELLTLFLSEEKSLRMQVTSLRCHHILLARGACNFPSITNVVQKFFDILQRSELRPTLQIEASKILHKILAYHLSTIPCKVISEPFLKLLALIKNVQQSSVVSARVLAANVLADLSGKVFRRIRYVSGGTGHTLASQVISFALDQILLLVTQKMDIHQPDSAVKHEVKSLINILNELVGQQPYLHCILVNNICLFIDKLMTILNKAMEQEKSGLSNHEMTEFGRDFNTLLESKLLLYVSKILFSCLQNLEATEAETNQALDLLKLQAENVCHCCYFGCYTRSRYFLLLHLHSSVLCMRHIAEELVSPSTEQSISCVGSVLQLDICTLDCANKILGRNSYWNAYEVGRKAACQGAWSTAAFMFEQLLAVVKSSSNVCWLKLLVQFSTSEKEFQLFLLSNHHTSIAPSESIVGGSGGVTLMANCDTYIKNLLGACNTLLSAEEILAISDMDHMFSFQRWFLTLRSKFLKSAIDMMKLLDTISYVGDGIGSNGQLEKGILLRCSASRTLGSLMNSSIDISCQLKNLAQELDLLLLSFMGMDRHSVTCVSALALSCSLLAFTAGFAFLLPNLHSSENYRIFKSEHSYEHLHALLMEDLLGRLKHKDCETGKKLMFLLQSFHNCFLPRLQTRVLYTSYEGVILQKLCEYSVGEIFRLQNEATWVQQDDAAPQILCNGSVLLLNIISKLLLIPFRTPHHFFRVRPAMLSELFVMNEDGQIMDGSSILSGLNLSLNLCYQLKNMPSGLPHLLNKVYCILSCQPHSQLTPETGESRGKTQLGRQDQDINDMMDLNEKLLRYVIGAVKTDGLHFRDKPNDSAMVKEYVCFELNERGQGFSTCLLDVSSLPIGSHRIKWHSCCIDSDGCYWSPIPLNVGPLFTIHNAAAVQ